MAFSFSPAVSQAIQGAAAKYGVDPRAMMTIAQLESRGNPSAKNPNSSAAGLYQFINSTAKQYGLSNPYDASASADAGARLARDNAAALSKVLGRAPTVGELYLAHQQGAGGARKLLSQPNARAVDVVGAQAVKLNGGRADMTAQEFANLWINKAQRVAGQKVAPSSNGLAMGQTGPAPLPDGPYGLSMGTPVEDASEPMTQSERLASVGHALMALDQGRAPSQPADTSHIFEQLGGIPAFQKLKGLSF